MKITVFNANRRGGSVSLIYLFVMFAFTAASGCQKQHQDTPAEIKAQAPTVTTALNKTLPILACSHPESCPPAIGELITYNDTQPSFCTASLIAGDVVVTASHCIPWRSVGDDHKFQSNCWIRFPEMTGRGKGETFPAVSVACSEVLDASDLKPSDGKNIQLDYAYIRLAQPVARPGLKFQDESQPPGKVHTTLLYGIHLGRIKHMIEFLRCSRDDDFDLTPLTTLRGQTVIMPSCAVQLGFSGGPILDPLTRDLVGVVSGVIGYDSSHPDAPRPSIGSRLSRPEFAARERPTRPSVQMK